MLSGSEQAPAATGATGSTPPAAGTTTPPGATTFPSGSTTSRPPASPFPTLPADTGGIDYREAGVGAGDGIGGGGEGAGGVAGDGGGPFIASARAVTLRAAVSGAHLELAWDKVVASTNPIPFDETGLYYQVLVRERPWALAYPLGERIAPGTFRSFRVAVPRTPGTRSYMVRACNTTFDGRTGQGYWGCKDSEEFTTAATRLVYDAPRLTGIGGGDSASVLAGASLRSTTELSFSHPVSGLAPDDLDVNVGTVTSVVRIADDRYRVAVDFGPPPFAATTLRIGLRAAAVERIGTAELNRTTLQPLGLPWYAASLYTYDAATNLVTSIPVGRGAMPDGSAGTATAIGAMPPRPVLDQLQDHPFMPRIIWRQATSLERNTAFYQLLVRDGRAAPLRPLGDRIPAASTFYDVYAVRSSTSNATFRIRACNTARPSPAEPFLLDGYRGCIDSREFDVRGTFVD